jgi:hypothetical protein
VFAEFPEEAGAQLDVATQKDARERLERHGANPFTVFDEDERFAIGFEFDISAVDERLVMVGGSDSKNHEGALMRGHGGAKAGGLLTGVELEQMGSVLRKIHEQG